MNVWGWYESIPRVVSIDQILSQLDSKLRYPNGEDEIHGKGSQGHQSKHWTELSIENPANLTQRKYQAV